MASIRSWMLADELVRRRHQHDESPHSRVVGSRQFSHSAIPTVAGLGWRIVKTTRDRIHCALAAGTSDGVDRDKRTNGSWAPEPQHEPPGGREIARLDRHQPLAPGPKRVRELFPAASECAAWKTRIP
jgi:hypothetical protein